MVEYTQVMAHIDSEPDEYHENNSSIWTLWVHVELGCIKEAVAGKYSVQCFG